MNLSLYLDDDTLIHGLDGRTKIICLLGLFALTLIFSDPLYLLVLSTGVLGLVLWTRSFINVKKIWILLVLLLVYNVVLWPFFIDGTTPLLTLGGVIIMREGVLHGLGMGLRLNAMLISGIVLLSPTSIDEFAE